MTKLIEQIKAIHAQLDEMERTIIGNMVMLEWTKAPEWAQWAAMNGNGEWYWYENEPELRTNAWTNAPLTRNRRFNFPPCTNWKESKRQRS